MRAHRVDLVGTNTINGVLSQPLFSIKIGPGLSLCQLQVTVLLTYYLRGSLHHLQVLYGEVRLTHFRIQSFMQLAIASIFVRNHLYCNPNSPIVHCRSVVFRATDSDLRCTAYSLLGRTQGSSIYTFFEMVSVFPTDETSFFRCERLSCEILTVPTLAPHHFLLKKYSLIYFICTRVPTRFDWILYHAMIVIFTVLKRLGVTCDTRCGTRQGSPVE